MKNVLILLKKEFLRFLADKPALILSFILPPVLILIFGLIFGNVGETQSKIPIIFVNQSKSEIAKTLEEVMDSSETVKLVKLFKPEGSKIPVKFDEKTAIEFVKKGKYSTALILPQDFFADTSTSLKIKIFFDPKNAIESSLIQGEIQKTLFTRMSSIFPFLMERKALSSLNAKQSEKFRNDLAKTISKYFNVNKDSIIKYTDTKNISDLRFSNSEEKDFVSGIIKIEAKQVVGKNIVNPGVARSVGGWASMFLLFTIMGASLTLFEEKLEGTLKRLLCMPVSRSQILWSKYLFSVLLGIVQLLTMFLFAWAVFQLDIFKNFGNLFVMIIVSSMAAVSFGMLITSFAKSLTQANGIAMVLILTMSAIGGAWFPTFLLPEWMQTVSQATIVYWSVDGFLQVLWRNAQFSAIALDVLILFSIGIVLTFYSIVRFSKGKIF